MSRPPAGRAHLATERANPRAADLDALPVAEAFDVFQAEDTTVAPAVGRARAEVVRAIELVAGRLRAGGRLVYVGAGTSGRLAVLDAVECVPTFQVEPGRVLGLVAGGPAALTAAVEGVEDDAGAGARLADEHALGPRDVLFGIAAGGTTPFVHGALARAKERGAATVFLACVPYDEAPDDADVSIRVVTGPEVLAGSTRLKAATATKLVLNRVSTLALVALGKTWGNRMVDLDTRANAKLRERGLGILAELTGLDGETAARLLDLAGGRVKVAAVMHTRGLGREAAEACLAACDGFLRRALEG